MEIPTGNNQTVIRRRSNADREIAEPVSNDSVYEIRDESLIMESSEKVSDWSSVAASISFVSNIGYIPVVTVISKVRALLEVKNPTDQVNVLSLKSIDVDGLCIKFLRWMPGFDTLPSSWLQPADRWIALFGVPYHLATYEILESMCKSFGKIEKYTQYAMVKEGVTGVKVKITGCDVKSVPQFIPLVDQGGVVYPIRVSILNGEDEESTLSEKAILRPTKGVQDKRKRSYADMARSNWKAKGDMVFCRTTDSSINSCSMSRHSAVEAQEHMGKRVENGG